MNQNWRKRKLAIRVLTRSKPSVPLLFKRPKRQTEAISNIPERRQNVDQLPLAIELVPIRRNHNDLLLMRPRERTARLGGRACSPLL
ncbi:hypothetical protein [Paraburkholderia tropica]|uniref:hypothetical protein n=1 Tax=Paraburkholderia tropica TaxID=92647 RepID=UPI00158FD303|nr:hypothetical protein [Paraburkholderia tropica]